MSVKQLLDDRWQTTGWSRSKLLISDRSAMGPHPKLHMSASNQNVKIRSHRDLIAWQKAMDLVVNVYILSRSFPPDELYALTKQVRRAVTSVPANIAEGQGRRSGREFHQFLALARGSLMELDTHLEVAFRVGYIKNEELLKIQKDLNEVGRILNGLMRSISASN